MPPRELAYYVEVGPDRRVVGPVSSRAVWGALRTGGLSFQAQARPAGEAEWRPLAWWLAEGDPPNEVQLRADAFDDAALTVVRRAPALGRPTSPRERSRDVIELDVEPDEDPESPVRLAAPSPARLPRLVPPVLEAVDVLGASRPSSADALPLPPPRSVVDPQRATTSPSLAPSTRSLSTVPPPPPRRRGWGRSLLAAAVLLGAVGIAASPRLRDGALALGERTALRVGTAIDRAASERSKPARHAALTSPEETREPSVVVDDELSRALRRAEEPAAPPPPLPRDPCDALDAAGRRLCVWAGLVSVGADVPRPNLSEVQAYLRSHGVRYAQGLVLEPTVSSGGWTSRRVTIDGGYGFCLAAPEERFRPGELWSGWVAPGVAADMAADCVPLEVVEFAAPLLELQARPGAPEAPALAQRLRRELAAFGERHPAVPSAMP